MNTRNVLIFLAIILGLVATVVASLFAGVEGGCTKGTDDCVRAMVEKSRQVGWLGIETEKPDSTTIIVTAVVPDSPAAAAGFAVGDVLMALDGVGLTGTSKETSTKLKRTLAPGDPATYTVARAGQKVDLKVRLGRIPEGVLEQRVGRHVMEAHARVSLTGS